MLTRRPHNIGLYPINEAPSVGDTVYHAGRAYLVDRVVGTLVRHHDPAVPMARVYGWPTAAPAFERRPREQRTPWLKRAFLGGLIASAAMVSTPGAHAIATAQYVERDAGHTTSLLMAYHAHGDPYACDFDSNGRYGRKQAECVVRVVFRRDGAATIRGAFRVIGGESEWHADATNLNSNGSTDCGPWQINSIHGQSCSRMKRWVPATRFARALWVRVGKRFSPTWVAATKLGVR